MKLILGIFISIVLTVCLVTSAAAASTEDCQTCHMQEYDTWTASAHYTGPGAKTPECEMCHQPPEKGFEAHITSPSEAIPQSNISAESCGNCHTGQHKDIYKEWNEYHSSGFDPQTMASHSEPTDVEESFVLNRTTCVSCKSTEGGILNIEDAVIHDWNEDNMPETENVNEWRIGCVACHEPHSSELRTTPTQLCASCHNSGGAQPDGNTTLVRYTQWEMYNGSSYTNGMHVTLECMDCHMATIIEGNNTTITGHTFDFDAKLLSDPKSGNTCKECHADSLSNLVTHSQGIIKDELEELVTLEENASNALTMISSNESYQVQLQNYNNALYYISEVESDNSFGVHNMERSKDNLETARSLFNSVIQEGKKSAEEEPSIPGFGILVSYSLMATAAIVLRKQRK